MQALRGGYAAFNYDKILKQSIKSNQMYLFANRTWPWAAHNKVLSWFARLSQHSYVVTLKMDIVQKKQFITVAPNPFLRTAENHHSRTGPVVA